MSVPMIDRPFCPSCGGENLVGWTEDEYRAEFEEDPAGTQKWIGGHLYDSCDDCGCLIAEGFDSVSTLLKVPDGVEHWQVCLGTVARRIRDAIAERDQMARDETRCLLDDLDALNHGPTDS